jgi:hypothetical protein
VSLEKRILVRHENTVKFINGEGKTPQEKVVVALAK